MEALGVAASVAGLISLSICAFHGCVQGIELVSAAQSIGKDSDRLRCMLNWEQYRLVQWGQRVGLGGDGNMSPNRRLNWDLITEVLKQLQSFAQ